MERLLIKYSYLNNSRLNAVWRNSVGCEVRFVLDSKIK